MLVPVKHWRLWEESGFLVLPFDRGYSVKVDIPLWLLGPILHVYSLTVCTIGALFNKWQLKDRFAPRDSSVEVLVRPALPIAICCENNNGMHRFTEISGPV